MERGDENPLEDRPRLANLSPATPQGDPGARADLRFPRHAPHPLSPGAAI
ncbi:MAG: hypothetical protein LC729_02950 [Acidobacteria bacterium]|nr:hypothetical protein [Acidobacteriota bacterium]